MPTDRLLNPWRRACAACTKAKRQCTKSTPRCRRCMDKRIQCLYPLARSPESQEAHMESTWDKEAFSQMAEDARHELRLVPADAEAPGLATEIATPPFTQGVPSTSEQVLDLRDHWFLATHSWNVHYFGSGEEVAELYPADTLETHVAIVQTWLKEWITMDHSPLMHRYLYRVKMPRCIQDAYTALAAYMGKTPSSEATVRGIIQDRLDQLVQDSALEAALGLEACTPIDHIARVQALLIYQAICLFDGNIRLRARAELHLPALVSWSDHLRRRIADDVRTSDHFSLVAVIGSSDPSLDPWRLWIFLESVRRTWLTCGILSAVYTTMKEGYSTCPGGLHCTLGRELWDAKSAHQWRRKALHGEDALFMQSLDVDELFAKARPDGVDEFGHALMLMSSGSDIMEEWKAKESHCNS